MLFYLYCLEGKDVKVAKGSYTQLEVIQQIDKPDARITNIRQQCVIIDMVSERQIRQYKCLCFLMLNIKPIMKCLNLSLIVSQSTHCASKWC